MQFMTQETTVEYDHSLAVSSVADFKKVLVSNYKNQLEAQLKDEQSAKAFMANAISIVQANPQLLECEPYTVFNGLMIMASLRLMPSSVSGEAYIIPYKNKGKLEAQFQLGYQGLITLFYRAGIQRIDGAMVYEKDHFELNGTDIVHRIDPNLKQSQRGKRIGAYTRVTYKGLDSFRYMNGEDIEAHAKKFSKSYNSEYSPWKNDPEGVMWFKTVLKQHAKTLPKNETINEAIGLDNRDSYISDRKETKGRLAEAAEASQSLKMGALEAGNDDE